MLKLEDTVAMMNSSDYKKRFIAEYQQLIIRHAGLKKMLDMWDCAELSFHPMCPRNTYDKQINAMTDYIAVLETRAIIEDIDLFVSEPSC